MTNKLPVDPFPNLPRRSLYAAVEAERAPADERVRVAKEAVTSGLRRKHPTGSVRSRAKRKKARMSDVKDDDRPVQAGAAGGKGKKPPGKVAVAPSPKRGRPETDKPWLVEGIGRAAWYKRGNRRGGGK